MIGHLQATSARAGRLLGRASRKAEAVHRRTQRRRYESSLSQAATASGAPLRVHLGCGPIRLHGWLNLDIERESEADVRIDLRSGLPLPPESTKFVFSEHVFEHFELAVAKLLLADIHRALTADGVLRIAMPDLATLVERYRNGWRDQEWLTDPGYSDIDSAAHMLNFALRSWGHLYVYDFDDLSARLRSAGFGEVRRVLWGESEHDDLRGLEQRPDSLLVVEATR